MKKIIVSNLSLKALFNHFYKSHETILIYDEFDALRGSITYNSFINSNSILGMIRNVFVIKDESEMEIGDLVNVYCIKEGDTYREVSKAIDPRYEFTIERFKDLYNGNDIIANYIKSLDTNALFIIGDHKEYLYTFLDMYGLDKKMYCIDDKDIPEIFKGKVRDTFIIDTTGFNTELFNKASKLKNLNLKIFDLKELSKYAEIYNFVHNTSKSEKVKSMVFQFPDISELTNLTEEEQKRIIFDHYYKYYFDAYLKHGEYSNLLQNVFREYFYRDFIKSRYTMPKVYNRGGVLFLEDSNNPYCRSYNGMRHTTNQDGLYPANINMFGACVVFSALSDDYNTLPSYLQRLLNENGYPYQVNNYGARAIDFFENLRTSRNINLHNNDINVFIVMGDEARILREMGYSNITSLTPTFNNPELRDYFVDEPAHCNHVANRFMANSIYQTLEKELIHDLTNENCPLISIPVKKDIFNNNRHLFEYLKTLEPYRDFNGVTGAVVMNCNPFTFGHYNLVKYASGQVDRLMVFVIQEDKSYFSFGDRFKMVQEGCKEFNNVIVVPSGNLLASALLFPEYFEKEDNPDVRVDASRDIAVFCQYIAPYLGITKRFIGQENFDNVTHAYNISLNETLPLYGIEVIEIPRFQDRQGHEISAKVVRRNFESDNWTELESQIPASTRKVLRLIKDRRERE